MVAQGRRCDGELEFAFLREEVDGFFCYLGVEWSFFLEAGEQFAHGARIEQCARKAVLADLAGFFEDVDVFFAELRVGMLRVVRVKELRQAECARHARGPAADDDYIGRHLRTFDTFEGFTEDQAHDGQRLARVAMSPRPSNLWSAVTRVSFRIFAVAAKKRSAGSARDKDRAMPVLTISRVKGASRSCSDARSTHENGVSTRIRPFCISTNASQTLTEDSQSSLLGSDNSARVRRPNRLGSNLLQIQMCVSRRRFNRGRPRFLPNQSRAKQYLLRSSRFPPCRPQTVPCDRALL